MKSPCSSLEARRGLPWIGRLGFALHEFHTGFGFYNGSRAWNIQREFYGRTYSAGFRVVR